MNQVETSSPKQATLYRMAMPKHTCPYGLKARHLLRSKGFAVDDRLLVDRAQTDAFKAEHDVKTTPQTFIAGTRIGGYDDLRRYFGLPVKDANATSYKPVIAVFAVAAAMAVATTWPTLASSPAHTVERFIAFTMCILALLKLQDLDTFSSMFLGYDVLARRFVPYAYVYPFAELLAGVLMAAHVALWLSAPVAIFVGSIGAWSVFKAVYLDKRELKCACVGGSGKVPLGFVSLTENVVMVAMAVWMVARSAL